MALHRGAARNYDFGTGRGGPADSHVMHHNVLMFDRYQALPSCLCNEKDFDEVRRATRGIGETTNVGYACCLLNH